MVNQLRSQITSLEVVDFEDLPGPVAGLLLHSQHLEGSQSHTMLIALLRKGKTLYWVNISTHTDEYLRLADELRAMIEGFVPEDEPEPAPDPDPPPLPRTLWPPA